MSDLNEPPWIRSYALTPRRLTEGGWVWLQPYEWRWERPAAHLPSAVNPPRVRSRRARNAPATATAAAEQGAQA